MQKDEGENRELSESHWKYTATILELCGIVDRELYHFLYVEAMIHGIKHGMDRGVA